jgi:diacylglycerol kinase (ATP)
VTRRVLLLINPHARQGEASHFEVQQQLQDLGLDVVATFAESPKSFSDRIREHGQKVDLVVIGGGDGSVNAAIVALLDTHLPLGVVPLGTANNLAKTLGMAQSMPEACATIAEGHLREIDLGCVNGNYFLNVAGIGLSANVNREVPKTLKRRWGVIAYAVTALRLILKQRRFRAAIHWQDSEGKLNSVRVKTYQITVCNGRYYGSGLTVAADAAIDDQRLDLCSLEIQHWWQAFLILPALLRGEFATGQGIRTLNAQEIRIVTRKPYAIDTDGELTTMTPAHFKILPKAIAVYVPAPSLR